MGITSWDKLFATQWEPIYSLNSNHLKNGQLNKYMTSLIHTHIHIHTCTHRYTGVWGNKSFPENLYSQVCSHIDLESESLLQHD